MYYLYYPGYYYAPYYQHPPTRQFPAVNPAFFAQSAKETKKLMAEAAKVLDRLGDSIELDTKIMSAAQASNTTEVKRLIHSIEGIGSLVDIKYNPDGLRLDFRSKIATADCCRLILSLRWR